MAEATVDVARAAISALTSLVSALEGKDKTIGELLQAVNARMSERDQARDARDLVDRYATEQKARAESAEASLRAVTETLQDVQVDLREAIISASLSNYSTSEASVAHALQTVLAALTALDSGAKDQE